MIYDILLIIISFLSGVFIILIALKKFPFIRYKTSTMNFERKRKIFLGIGVFFVIAGVIEVFILFFV
jgi:hypothetical protein